MKSLESVLSEHPFFRDMERADLELLAGCASNARFEPGAYVFREGEAADRFYLVRHGRIAVEYHDPARGTIRVMTAGPGDVLGFSWLLPPYRWASDARALELARATVFDGACLREKCEHDPRLGYDLLKRVAGEMMRRLKSTRIQLLDLYRGPGGAERKTDPDRAARAAEAAEAVEAAPTDGAADPAETSRADR